MPARSSRVHPAACRVDPDHPVNAPLYRQRDVRHGPRALACVALLAIAGCTSKSAPAPTDEATPARADAPTSGSKEAPASQPASAPVLIADFSAPVSGAGATASVYDDGVAIVSWSEGIGKGPPILRRFELRPDEVDHLRRRGRLGRVVDVGDQGESGLALHLGEDREAFVEAGYLPAEIERAWASKIGLADLEARDRCRQAIESARDWVESR